MKGKALGILFVVGIALAGYILATKLHKQKNESITSSKEEATMNDKPFPSDEIVQDSGLRYRILSHGNGETTPKPGDKLMVHYTGWINDGNDKPGRKFDSSRDRNQPFTFQVGKGQVIEGWDEGLLQMKEGDRFMLYIPSKLGYGASGYPPVIPQNANLIFDVELIKINP